MITVEEAKQLLFADVPAPKTAELELRSAVGYILAKDIFSPMDVPLFNQSVMDGYALATGSSNKLKRFNVVGEIKAGGAQTVDLKEGEAVRIFTGAAVPVTADTVVMQEKVKADNGSIYLSEEIKQGEFVRLKGAQIKQGELALKKDSLLNPVSIGFLASLGIGSVKVYARPKVSILVTGDELTDPGNVLQEGRVYEANSFSLQAALQLMQIIVTNILISKDDKEELKKQLSKCLAQSDVVLITGGISVGKYDYVYDVLNELKVETIFYKVSQKPGKPLLAGKLGDKRIFALPGNPASVLVCFYEYAYPVIRMMQGIKAGTLAMMQLKLLKDVSKKEDRAFFGPSKRTDEEVMALEKQDSSMLRFFAEADVLIYIPMEKKNIKAGEMVEVHLLPFNN